MAETMASGGTGMTAGQRRMIYGSAHRLHMDDDMLHTLVNGLTGCASMKELNQRQAGRVIDRLNELEGKPNGGGTSAKRSTRTADVPGRATQAQRGKIYALARELGWADDPKRLRGFTEKMARVSDIRFASMEQAGVIIEALKAMADGGRGERRHTDADK